VIEMTMTTASAATRIVDARGSFCPGPLMELIRAIRESSIGAVIAVYSSDRGSRIDIPKWIEKAGHRLVALETRDGFDEIIVEKCR
jgi:tRNA 2-thiouridine synthesizing protein A